MFLGRCISLIGIAIAATLVAGCGSGTSVGSEIRRSVDSTAPCSAAALFQAAVRAEHLNTSDPGYQAGGNAAGLATVVNFRCKNGWAYGLVGRPAAGTDDGGTVFRDVRGVWQEVGQYPVGSGSDLTSCGLHEKFGVPLADVNTLTGGILPCGVGGPPASTSSPTRAATPTSVGSWTTYETRNYPAPLPFRVDVPTAMVATSSQGRAFESPDGLVHFAVYSVEVGHAQTPESVQRDEIERFTSGGGRVTYAPLLDNGFVVSGIDSDGSISYFRAFVLGSVEYGLAWTYPASMKTQLDAAVTRSFTSFAPGSGAAH